MNDSSLVAVDSEPGSLVAIDEQCDRIEAWAEQCSSEVEIRQRGLATLSAMDAYLEKTSSDGRARVNLAMRRLEKRVGELLGPAPGHGGRRPKTQQNPHRDEDSDLPD